MTTTKSNYPRKAHDLYQTEAWATRAVLRYINVKGKRIWEPAAGHHKMADVLTEAGAEVITSDIKQYSKPHTYPGEWNFLSHDCILPLKLDGIVTNPPYGFRNYTATKFVERALLRCPKGIVAMLLTAKWDSASTRRHLTADNPRFYAKVVLTDRLSLMLNGRSGTEDHAWFIWDMADTKQFHPPKLFYEGKDGNE